MNALTVVQHQPPAFTMSDLEKVAGAIAKGGLFGSKDPYAVLTLCLLAQAEGQHPAVVFRDYHIISGKPAKKADAMLRDFISGGGKVEWHRLDDECADATFSHPAGGTARITWDKQRVIQAQLGSNPMHKKYPRQMLRARVVSEGVRTVYPGATSGLYVPEETAAFENSGADDAPMAEADEPARDGPSRREKLDGPHSSRTKLKAAISAIDAKVRAAESVQEIVAIGKENAETIKQAKKDWPSLLGGDPDIPEAEGLLKLVERRKAELAEPEDSMFNELIATMKQCDSLAALKSWANTNGALVDELDDATRRAFESEYESFEAGLMQVGLANAG